MTHPEASVIISFYRNLKYLKLVLAGFERQSFKNFEIVIADDGSDSEIVSDMKNHLKKTNLNFQHIWHKDEGWRKNKILNKSIIHSKSDYLIFVDGDCIPHKHYVEEHIKNKKPGFILAGRRVNLSKYISSVLTTGKIRKGRLERSLSIKGMLLKFILGGSHLENAIYIRSPFIRKRLNKKEKGVLGSNFSVYKKDILAVNGFDERYKKPAVGEDTDLEFRMRNAGIKVKTLKHLAIQYHLYHKKLIRDDQNMKYLNDVINNKTTYTPYGIEQKI